MGTLPDLILNQKTMPVNILSMPSDSGPIGVDYSYYIHDQMVSSKNWTVTHNLNRYPSVFITDTAGNVVMGDILYVSKNEVILTFSEVFSGRAYVG